MAVRELQSNKVFLRSPDEGLLTIYELDFDAPNSYAVKAENWNFVAFVVPKRDTLLVNGASIRGHMLQKLQEDLCRGRLSVNREGLCYLGREGITRALFDLDYYRLNNLFSWSDYVNDQDKQVNQAVETAWNRCDMRKGDVLVDYKEKENELQELMQSVEEKEEELHKLKEDVKMLRQHHSCTGCELKKELKKVQEKYMELQRTLTYSETEPRLKTRQLDKVKEESLAKKEESGSLLGQLTSAQAELKFTNDDLEEKVKELGKKDKELKEVKDQLCSAQAKLISRIEEVQKKDKELESLGKNVRELERNGLSITTFRTCVDIFLDIVLRRRLPLAPEEFKDFPDNLNTEAFKFPPKGETRLIYTPVDSDKHTERINIIRARYTSDGRWDKKNWWLVTVCGHKAGPFAIAYYGGNFDSTEAYGTSVSIPFKKGATFKSGGDDQVGFVRGIGMRFLFTFKCHE